MRRYTHQLMGASRKPKGKDKVWTTTKVENLLRHKGGTYYCRFRMSGKRNLISLETKVFSTAKLRLRDKAVEAEKLRGSKLAAASGTATMGDLLETYREQFKSLEVSEATKADREVSLKRLLRTWPNFETLPPRKITSADVWTWANRLKNEGSGFRPPGATKPARVGASRSTVNRSVTALQQLLDIAVEVGAVHVNAARQKPPAGFGRLRKKSESKPVHLPPHDKMQALFDELERPGDWSSGYYQEKEMGLGIDGDIPIGPNRMDYRLHLWQKSMERIPMRKAWFKPPLQTPTSGTPAANAPVAPSPGIRRSLHRRQRLRGRHAISQTL